MPFHLYVHTATRLHGIRNIPDSDRTGADEVVADFKHGMPIDRRLIFHHNQGDLTLRWGDVSDVWIEDAS